MTSVLDRMTTPADTSEDRDEPMAESDVIEGDEHETSIRRLSTGPLVALWMVIAVVVLGLVLYVVEPMFQERDQGL